MAEYAIYKGDKLIFEGGVDEIAKHFGVKKSTVYFWASAPNKRYADTGYRPGMKKRKKECGGMKVAVRIDENVKVRNEKKNVNCEPNERKKYTKNTNSNINNIEFDNVL